MILIKIAMREIQKREDMRWVIYTDYRLVQLNARHREQQKKPPNIKSDI